MTNPSHGQPELLAPVGGMEQLKAALRFGADAVYGGLNRYGLRAAAANFTPETLKAATAETHRQGKRFYVPLNLLPFDRDMEGFLQAAKEADAAGADAVIVSDLGAALMLKDELPALELHISTQANVLNTRTARHFYEAAGAKRIVLSREMSLDDIRTMRAALPNELQLEAFVHGAMCVAYSGRCLLSAALTGRSANRGECAQPCRWHYAVAEEKRPGAWMPLEEEERGTALFSSYDLCMLPHLPALIGAGVESLKIEGRMKTAYYVATVVSAYRHALDILYGEGEAAYEKAVLALMAELGKASHRVSNTGFYFGAPQPAAGAEGFEQSMEFVGRVTHGAKPGEPAEIELKNRFYVGDLLEALTPEGSRPFRVESITLADTGEPVDTAGVAGTRINLSFPFAVGEGDLLRGPNRNHQK
ncbi:MAG: U32 family peptidase [Eubacteriales bacterium]|nr:U32 family peptidase [Eubacteriales bacterium]